MKTENVLLAITMWLITAGGLAAQETPRALGVKFEEAWRAARPPTTGAPPTSAFRALELVVGDRPQEMELAVPALTKREGMRTSLRLQALLYTKTPGGWNNYLAFKVDGKPITGHTAEHRLRLLNRGQAFNSSIPSEGHVSYCRGRAGLSNYVVFFGPDFNTLDERLLSDRREGYWYLFDFSDVLMPGVPHTLTLVNTALAEYWKGKTPEGLCMIVDNLAIGYVSDAEVEALCSSQMKRRAPVPGTELKSQTMKVSVAPGGGLQLETAGEQYFIETSCSYPSGPDLANELSCAGKPASGEAGWKPVIQSVGGDAVEIRASGRSYSLVRRVRSAAHCVEVEDELANLTDAPLGIRIHHHVLTSRLPESWRLAGVEGEDFAGHCVENPTVFISQRSGGLGIFARDNVLRAQMEAQVETNDAQFSTNHFGLKPKTAYALRWAIYPCSTEYFDFINVLRRELGVNFTVEGPFDFVGAQSCQTAKDAQERRARLQRKRYKIFALSPWFIYFNRDFEAPWGEYKALMQQAIKTIKSVQPDALCIALLESNLTPISISFFKDTLPAGLPLDREHGKYGYVAPKAATALLDASTWRDSLLRDADGNVLLDTYYAMHYAGKGLNLMVYPTLDNSWHREMMRRIAFCLDEVGFDGIYFDQFSMAFGDTDRYTREFWDGHTVDIDPATGKVSRMYAELGMLTAPARRQWVEAVLSRKKIVVANSTPAVNELQGLPIWRFMEAEYSYDPLVEGPPNGDGCARGHLASPIGLGCRVSRVTDGARRAGEIITRSVIANLQYGLLYYYYGANIPESGEGSGAYGPVNHMFPFTPVELHRGWILGKERLITCLSGAYRWPYDTEPKCYLFDRVGRDKTPAFKVVKGEDGYKVSIALDDWHEIAVLER